MAAKYVPIEDVCEHLTVSAATIRGWVRRGSIPPGAYIKVGTTYRFSLDEVLEALKSHTLNEAMHETMSEADYAPSNFEPSVVGTNETTLIAEDKDL